MRNPSVPGWRPTLPTSSGIRGGIAGVGWRRAAISLVVLGVSAFGGLKLYQHLHPAAAATAAVQTQPVATRTINELVTLPGTVGAGRLATLSFQAASNGTSVSGIVKSVSVKTGDAVTAGQEMARLDTTSLDLAVQAAQSGLNVAQIKMQQLLAGSQPNTVASAEQSVISATAALQKAQNDLVNLQHSPTQTSDQASAQQAVLSAQVGVATAQQALDALQGRATNATQARDAQAAADRMNAQLTSAQAALATALSTLDSSTFNPNVIRSAISDLDNALRGRCGLKGNHEQCAVLATSAVDIAGLVNSINAGMPAIPTDLSAVLVNFQNAVGGASNASAITQAVLQQEQAQAALPGLSDRANNLVLTLSGSPGSPDAVALTDATRARDAAQATLTATQAKLAALQSGPLPTDVQAAQNTVTNAQAALNSAVANRNSVVGGPLPTDVALQEQSAVQAQIAVNKAVADQQGAVLTAPFDGLVGTITMNVGAASGSGSIQLIDPLTMQLQATAQETDIAKLQVGQPVALSFDAYAGVTVPGTVSSVSPIATVTQGVAAYPVVVTVQQAAQAGSAQPQATPASGGQATPPAGGQGTPRSAGTGTPRSGTPRSGGQGTPPAGGQATPLAGGQATPLAGGQATPLAGGQATPLAGVQGTPPPGGQRQRPANIVLRSGMTGTANVQIASHPDVIAVPAKAIKRQGRTSIVQVMVAGKQEARTVQTGATDGTYTEITSGLNVGDTIVTGTSGSTTTTPTIGSATTTGGGAGPGAVPGGGGFGGGGGPGGGGFVPGGGGG